MFDSTPVLPTDLDHEGDRERYLGSHRALAACAREFGQLAASAAALSTALAAELGQGKPEVRQSPERCIVQLGPVALTLAWLRSTLDTVADGQLLAIVWEGTVARRPAQLPERLAAPDAAKSAVAVWEEVLVASATGEGSWRWEVESDATRSYSSAELAARCVDRLRTALTDRTP